MSEAVAPDPKERNAPAVPPQAADVAELAAALAAAQAEFPAIPKSRTAQVRTRDGSSYSYAYATLPDILKAIVPALSKHGLTQLQVFEMREASDGFYLVSRLIHTSGQEIRSELPIPWERGMSPQALGSWLTYARRYLISAQVGVAAEEDDDAQAAEAEEAAPAKRGKGASGSNSSAPKGGTAGGGRKVTEAQRKRLWAIATDAAERLQVPRAMMESIVRGWISDLGFEGTGDLTKKPYDNVCERLERLSLNDLAKQQNQRDGGGDNTGGGEAAPNPFD